MTNRAIEKNKATLGEVIPLYDQDIPDTLKSDNYKRIMDTVSNPTEIQDTFGLCGVVALYSLLHRHPKFHEIDFDPKEYLQTFLEGSETASSRFKREIVDNYLVSEINQKLIKDYQSMMSIFQEVESGKSGIMVAYLCEYPNREGQHTHWLYCEQIDETHAILVGDLRPFGITDTYVVQTTIDNLVEGLSKSIGAKTTADLPQTVHDDSHRDGDYTHDGVIANNVSIKRYIL